MKYNKKIMVLGGGSSQIELIKECVRQGHYTILADIDENAPGRHFASAFEKASTFDIEAVIKAAEKNRIDAVLTAGTDQPVLTSASAAEKLRLPQFLDRYTALSVTNKKVMKKIFSRNGIASSNFRIVNKYFKDSDLEGLKPPYVIKPFDSQGQRGVFMLDTVSAIREMYDITASFSRKDNILVEEYYDSDEITVSGWVRNGDVYIFTVTDRVTFQNLPTIGVCSSHIFPSAYTDSFRQTVIDTTVSITEVFGIKNGPIYFQYLIGSRGLIVNEIACRLGGAYEDEFIPLLTGIDLRKLLIKGSLGYKITDMDFRDLRPFEINTYGKYVSVPLLFCSEGKIGRLIYPDKNKIKSMMKFSYLHKKGTQIKKLNNSTQRAGYAVLLSDNYTALNSDVKMLFESASVEDENRINILMDKYDQSVYKDKRRFT